MIERSLVVLKPDAVQRGIVGEIIHRFERAGLKIIAMKLVQPTKNIAEAHYVKDDSWKKRVGELNIKECQKYGINPEETFGTSDPIAIGDIINKTLYDYLLVGPVLAIVLEGVHAVENIRMFVGPTFAVSAPPGTIRGDFCLESSYSSLKRKRASYNLIHASDSPENAEREIALWFKPDEILSYKRVHEDLYNY